MTTLSLILSGLEDTRRLGQALAAILVSSPLPLLLHGEMGAGKTTLVRFLAEHLPGGEEAEVMSPSFTLCNVYPTRPELRHFDLYRLPDEQTVVDEGLAESLEDSLNPGILLALEWPEKLPPVLIPPDYLLCRLTGQQNDRRAVFEPGGAVAALLLEKLRKESSVLGRII
ncbi:MAG: tRNA (adenosine(37)-N6)-threonylcarbamoyltransferase complex ATPase subunit type 1 TsaE [Desulfovibrionaceae bacterium]|nr:tRNA (adenosine(37)-N6)-threonylcarbamoyltransferase complex ATPase subunit type 1 TsaE [Desulfovibrionaceae bacterium]